MTLVNHPASPCSWMARTVIQGPRVLTGREDPHPPQLMQVLAHCDWLPAHRRPGPRFLPTGCCQRTRAGLRLNVFSAALVPLGPAGFIHPNPQRFFCQHPPFGISHGQQWIVDRVQVQRTKCVVRQRNVSGCGTRRRRGGQADLLRPPSPVGRARRVEMNWP